MLCRQGLTSTGSCWLFVSPHPPKPTPAWACCGSASHRMGLSWVRSCLPCVPNTTGPGACMACCAGDSQGDACSGHAGLCLGPHERYLDLKKWVLQNLDPPLQSPKGGNQPQKHALEPPSLGRSQESSPRAALGGAFHWESREMAEWRAVIRICTVGGHPVQPQPGLVPAPSTIQSSLSTGTQGCPPPSKKGHRSSARTCMSTPLSQAVSQRTGPARLIYSPGDWMPGGLEGAGCSPCP